MQAVGLQTYIWNNNIRSTLLLIGFPILLLGMVFFLTLGMIWARMLPSGYEYGGAVPFALHLMIGAAPAAILVAAIWFAIAYVFNQAIIDFATGSRPASREEEPRAYNLLENLCISRGLRMPTLRVIETEGMNAFASGLHEGRFSVTVTRDVPVWSNFWIGLGLLLIYPIYCWTRAWMFERARWGESDFAPVGSDD